MLVEYVAYPFLLTAGVALKDTTKQPGKRSIFSTLS
jgi:hypothetical protein